MTASFILLLVLCILVIPAFAARNIVTVKDITFTWIVNDNVLSGTLTAPGKGWVAVRFGGDTILSSGKMVIGSIYNGKQAIEIQNVSWRSHSLAEGKLIKSKVIIKKGRTIVTFKAYLADLGLDGKTGKTFQITLSANKDDPDLEKYRGGTRGSAIITL